ncbi:SDR family oxidoreductase [Naasia sp. SYSU D00057]|uniref:SDR family oxidoreductase n=1 Tax=Naasia sp. SYSU D00057 TaxID=2817380 RepID=UPI0027DC87DB|nr:SDR family oxidoreductase [Naasia sp. SYSU D00057]
MGGTALRDSTVLVTGGGSGIGRLMALGAAGRGARVVIWDLDRAAGEGVRDRIRSLGGTAHAFEVDVADREQVREAAAATLAAVDRIDVLVGNAGVVTGKRLLEATEEQIARTFEVNVLALYWVARAFLPGMIARRRGTVVTIASAAGLIGVARQTDYSASKHAAVGFDESLRAELRADRTGVRTLVVCPYYIDTGMFAGVRTRFPLLLPILQPKRVAVRILDAIESGRSRLLLPPFVRLLPVTRLLPVRAFDALADLLGVNRSMSRFTGRR